MEALKNHRGQQAFHVRFARAHHMQPLVNLSVILPNNSQFKAFGLKDIFCECDFSNFYVVPWDNNILKILNSSLAPQWKESSTFVEGME